MKLYKFISNSVYFFIAAVSSLLLTSCGSYQYAGKTTDGIYGDNESVVSNEEIEYGSREENTGYYKKLFEEEAALYGDVLAEDAVFTDVDSYSSTGNYDYENAENYNYQGGNAPWGNSPDRYTINIYNDGFYGGFYDPFWISGFNGYAFDPFWNPGFYGPGFYGPGFYGSPYYGRGFYGNYGYGYGYGFGFGFNNFYGGPGWYNPYYHPYNRQHHFRQNVAYNAGRRGESSYYSNRTNAIRNAADLDNRGRSSTYSRSIRNLRNSNDESGISRRSSRSYDTGVNADGRYSRGRSTSNGVSTPTRSRSVYSTNRTSRSQSPTARSSSSSNRSTTTRSTSSGRSSGSTTSNRSSGSNNRGRGN